jgi:thioredoxin reductase (NADPH)
VGFTNVQAHKIKGDFRMYDVIIIGAGVVGYATAMYAGRMGMKSLVIGAEPGGTITKTNMVENYPGFKKLTGQELADNLREHALDYKEFVELKDSMVTKIQKKDDGNFSVSMGENVVEGKTVIYATGSKWRELQVPGHDDYLNKGVHYCALCDGFFYRKKITAVVGGSDSAAKDALVLAEHADKVYIIYRKESIRAEPPNIKRVNDNPKIEIINNTNVLEMKGDNVKGLTSVKLDKEFNGSDELALDGLFIAIGHLPLSDLAKEVGVVLNKKNEIMINRKSETNVPGFFAAGDVADTHFKQAITGVAEGVLAAYGAYEYINQ